MGETCLALVSLDVYRFKPRCHRFPIEIRSTSGVFLIKTVCVSLIQAPLSVALIDPKNVAVEGAIGKVLMEKDVGFGGVGFVDGWGCGGLGEWMDQILFSRSLGLGRGIM